MRKAPYKCTEYVSEFIAPLLSSIRHLISLPLSLIPATTKFNTKKAVSSELIVVEPRLLYEINGLQDTWEGGPNPHVFIFPPSLICFYFRYIYFDKIIKMSLNDLLLI